MVDAGVRDYLWEITKIIDSASGTPFAKDDLMRNTFEEISGQEAKIMLDPRCGPALETFMPLLNAELTCRLLDAVNTQAIDICADKCSSRILEKLLLRVGELISSHEPEIEKLIDGLITLSDKLEKESWADAITDPNGSHVTRTLIQVLATDQHNSKLRNALHSTCAGIISAIGENMSEAIVHVYANPVVQYIVEALSPNKPFVKLVVDRIISAIEDEDKSTEDNNNDDDNNDKTEERPDVTTKKFISISCNPVGSRLIEKILEFSSENIYATLYTKWFRGSLYELACDKIGNHIVQKLLSSTYCQTPQATLIVKEFLPRIGEFLRIGKNEGVIMQIADACLTHEVCQKEFFDTLKEALCTGDESDEKEENVALALLKSPSPAYIRSRIAQSLLRMNKSVSRPFCEALLSLDSDFVTQIALDKSGSRVIEAAVESKALPIQVHLKIFEAYIGSFTQLALSPCGSHILEKLYFGSDLKNKEKIAHELMENERTLAGDRIGKYALRTCKVSLYREKRNIWMNGANKNEKKREMFDDILNDNEGTEKKKKDDKATEDVKKKKSEDKVSAHMKDDYEMFMEKLGFGSKKTKSEEGKKVESEKKKKKEEEEEEEGKMSVEKEEGKVDSKEIDSLNKSVIDVLSGTKKKSKSKAKKREASGVDTGEEPSKKKSKKDKKSA